MISDPFESHPWDHEPKTEKAAELRKELDKQPWTSLDGYRMRSITIDMPKTGEEADKLEAIVLDMPGICSLEIEEEGAVVVETDAL